jgi:hypothetical protein
MTAKDVVEFVVVRTEPLERQGKWLLADDDLGLRFHALLESEELELVFREFRVPPGMAG